MATNKPSIASDTIYEMRLLPIILIAIVIGVIYITQTNQINFTKVVDIKEQKQNNIEYIAENPQPRVFNSKLLDFTITIPSGYTSSIKNEENFEYLMIDKSGDNVTLAIYPNDCPYPPGATDGRGDPQHLNIGAKYPITLGNNGSISHGASDHFYSGQTKLNGYCMDIKERLNTNSIDEIARILEGK